jgi:uroporphyrinogen decarboxylase
MNKRERLERTMAGEKPDRLPVALWRHWPGDDQRANDLAQSILAFQNQWDFDFVNIMPARHYAVIDQGLQDRWGGALDGTRETTRYGVTRSLEWTELRRLEPNRGSLGQQIETLMLLQQAFGEETPFILTIYSPLTQAGMLAGAGNTVRHLRTHPERLKTALAVITDNMLRFIEALRKVGLAGIFYATEFAGYDMMSEEEYRDFGCPYDLKILEALPTNWWFNIVHISNTAPMLEVTATYPIQVLSWNDRESFTALSKGKTKFGGTVCGGLSRRQPVHLGMPGEVRDQAVEAVEQTYGRKFILSTGSPLLITTPYANIRAARQFVESGMG